jgi:TatD DNase family protein
MQVVDIGVNCAGPHFPTEEDVQSAVRDARVNGVFPLIAISNSLAESAKNRAMCADLLPKGALFHTVGVHPEHASDVADVDELFAALESVDATACVAVGECGLDYKFLDNKAQQQAVFDAQIRFAQAKALPLYLHCRDAYEDFVALLKRRECSHGVVHCFTGMVFFLHYCPCVCLTCALRLPCDVIVGSPDQARELLDMGFFFGITGWLLDMRRNRDLVAALEEVIPLDRVLVETDTPWLSVDRRRPSRPTDVLVILARVAELKGVSLEAARDQVLANTLALFPKLR